MRLDELPSNSCTLLGIYEQLDKLKILLQNGYTTIGDVAVDVSLPAKYIVKCE